MLRFPARCWSSGGCPIPAGPTEATSAGWWPFRRGQWEQHRREDSVGTLKRRGAAGAERLGGTPGSTVAGDTQWARPPALHGQRGVGTVQAVRPGGSARGWAPRGGQRGSISVRINVAWEQHRLRCAAVSVRRGVRGAAGSVPPCPSVRVCVCGAALRVLMSVQAVPCPRVPPSPRPHASPCARVRVPTCRCVTPCVPSSPPRPRSPASAFPSRVSPRVPASPPLHVSAAPRCAHARVGRGGPEPHMRSAEGRGGGGAAVRTRCQKAVWRRRRACAVMRAALRAVPLMAAAVAGSGAGPKRARTEPPLRIGTHDGTFHCDEALACYLLRLLPRYRVRPRPPRAPPHPDPVPPCGPRPSSGPPRPAGLRGVTEEPPWGPRPRVRDAFGSPILHWGRCGVLSVLLGSSFSAGAALISPAVSLLPPNDHSCIPALCWAPRSHLEATLWSPGRCQSPWSYLGDAFRSPILHWGRTGLPSSLLGYSDPRGGRPYVPISPWRSLTSPVPPCPPPASPHCSAGRRGGADPGPPAPGPVRCGGGCGGRI